MKPKSGMITAGILSLVMGFATTATAQEMDDPAVRARVRLHSFAPPCTGAAAFVCAALAIPLAIAAIDEAIDAACPGAFPPGQWPEDAQAAFPQYPEQWYRDCGD